MTDVLLDEELQGRLVVSTEGDDVAQVRGAVERDGEVVALRLAKTGLFGGDLDEVLPRAAVRGVGPDAVVIGSVDEFVLPEDLADSDRGTTIVTAADPATDAVERPDGALLFSPCRTREVVSDADGEPVGRVDRFVVDPATRRVASLRLDNVSDMRRYLSWRDISTFGDDRVTIPDDRVLRLGDGPREERIRRDYGMLGKRIITDAGHELGKVVDVTFSPEDGAVTTLVLEDQELGGDRLLGVGPYAVVVTH